MSDDIDIRCDLSDPDGLLREIRRRDKIIEALMNQVQHNLNSPDRDFSLLQTTFILEQEVSSRTAELERALDAVAGAKREAEASQHQLSAAISTVSDGFALFDQQDRLVLCNDAYRKLWGFQFEVNGHTYVELLSDVARRLKTISPEWWAKRLQDHRSGTGASEFQINGRILQIRERRTPDGYTAALYADITDLVEARASEAARQQLLEIIEFLPDATFVVDAAKRVIAWNRAVVDMTGIPKDEILGLGESAYGMAFYGEPRPTLLDLLNSSDPEIESHFQNLQPRGDTLYGEDFVPRAFGGRGAYVGRMASKLLDSQGNYMGAVESLRDLTDSKRAEADLLSMQEQLRQAAKMEAIGRLAGGIAHDFNNQLTIVQGYSKLLLDNLSCGSSGRKFASEILRAAERSAQLTTQLLAFGRKQVLHSEVLNLREVLTSLRDPLARMIGEDIQLEMNIAPDLSPIETDKNQLEQALINLAINARDAMPKGGRLIIEAKDLVLDSEYVLRHMGASEGEQVCLSVRDTGIGMDELTSCRIFEPFFTTKPVGVGTGLGLAMVYGFVKQSDGHIEVISELGHGSTFNLYFHPASVAPKVHETVRRPLPPTPRGSETILIIEDQEPIRDLTAYMLRTTGYNVLEAGDGASAIELSRQYPSGIDLVLCDVIMPGLTGPETARQLVAERRGIKVLYVSGYAERIANLEAEPTGRVLSKPFTPEMLFRVVRQALDEDEKICA